MENVIAVIVLLIILGAAILYIVKAKKKGVKCIGCPAAGQCKSKSGCGCNTDTKA